MMSDIEPEGEYYSEIYDLHQDRPTQDTPRVVVQLDRLEPNPIHEVPEMGRINSGGKTMNALKTNKPRYQL